MTTPARGIPLIDLSPWFIGSADDRVGLAQEVDRALQRVGFLVITGHGVSAELISAVRAAAKDFFALPRQTKEQYATKVGGRGWLAIGGEANGYSEGTETPPDLKESFIVGPQRRSESDADSNAESGWFAPNVWPTQTPELRVQLEWYLAQMRALADALLSLCAQSLQQDPAFFCAATQDPSWSFQLNWYPSRTVTGTPQLGQFRIGPHTDFGTVTILDRQAGDGGLQIDIDGEGWVDAPDVPGALIVNTGDLLARWTGERWRSNRHRVLPPPASAPDEELLSLVYFFEADPLAVVTALPRPIGHRDHLPDVEVSEFLRARYDAITMA